MMGEQQSVADIGDISELNGVAQILRDKPLQAELNLGIQSNLQSVYNSLSSECTQVE